MALARKLLSQFGSVGPHGKHWIVGPDLRAWYKDAPDEDLLGLGLKETREDSPQATSATLSPSASLFLLPPIRLPGRGPPSNPESIFRQPRPSHGFALQEPRALSTLESQPTQPSPDFRFPGV